MRLLESADLLFLPMQKLAPGLRSGNVPGKTYEYLASGRPILAAVPEGDARDILSAAGNASLCRPADVTCLAAAIREQIELWRAGAQRAVPDPEVTRLYERRYLTERLAGVLDAL